MADKRVLPSKIFLLIFIISSFMIVQIPTCHGGSHHPFAAKSSLLRFWRRVLPNARLPPFLLQKASPLNATSVAVFAGYIANHTLSDHIASFCTAADLLCTRSMAVAGDVKAVTGDADFQSYHGKEFKHYKVGGDFGTDSFKNYSDGDNVVKDDFKGYGQDGNGRSQVFANYAPQTNVEDEGFKTYGSGGSAGSSGFSSYGSNTNVPDHHFKNYGTDSNAANQDFKSYADNSNVVKNDFASYGKDANGIFTDFTSYAENSNVITNSFKGYSENGNGPLDRFTSYADNGNVPRNEFESYGSNGNGALETFSNYADGANVPQDVFKSYGKDANSPLVQFTNYGNSSNTQQDEFKQYGKGSNSPTMMFTSYGVNTQFKEYDKNGTGAIFSSYTNSTDSNSGAMGMGAGVEAGKFFRENLLVQGSSLPLPSLKDYMPRRSFLPRSLVDKLPSFSNQSLAELVRMFHIPENSSMEGMMAKTLKECERPAVKGEIKKCVTSIEGMAEFAVGILGAKVEVLTTASTAGSGELVQVGEVNGKSGGRVTRSVSCHQSMFPYLVYYCHSVPKVKVYEAALMRNSNQKEKIKKINDGVAICHLDTTQWSAGHAAFVALGHKPGQIEVCHWIFENDLIWVPLP
jgi:hypothetical protein